MHVAYAFQEGEEVTNYDHPELTPHPFPLYFSGPRVVSASIADGKATIRFEYGDALFLNDTMGCDIRRDDVLDFDGASVGGAVADMMLGSADVPSSS